MNSYPLLENFSVFALHFKVQEFMQILFVSTYEDPTCFPTKFIEVNGN
jgi:hypothetical protein